MHTGAITSYIDVAQLVLYGFWIFFIGLIYYLHQENKREGYPLEEPGRPRVRIEGFPAMPRAKTYHLADGSQVTAPRPAQRSAPLAAGQSGGWSGAPITPTGDPLLSGIGPGSAVARGDHVELTFEGTAKIVPLRADPEYRIAHGDPKLVGWPVRGADGRTAGTVCDVWVDRSEALIRYIEVSVAGSGGPRNVLLPIPFARIGERAVEVKSIYASQFAQVPVTKEADRVTRYEEEKIAAFYGGGTLYADASRAEPWL